jgi:hypothetical protein
MLSALHSVVILAYISEELSFKIKTQFGITSGKYCSV